MDKYSNWILLIWFVQIMRTILYPHSLFCRKTKNTSVLIVKYKFCKNQHSCSGISSTQAWLYKWHIHNPIWPNNVPMSCSGYIILTVHIMSEQCLTWPLPILHTSISHQTKQLLKLKDNFYKKSYKIVPIVTVSQGDQNSIDIQC